MNQKVVSVTKEEADRLHEAAKTFEVEFEKDKA